MNGVLKVKTAFRTVHYNLTGGNYTLRFILEQQSCIGSSELQNQ